MYTLTHTLYSLCIEQIRSLPTTVHKVSSQYSLISIRKLVAQIKFVASLMLCYRLLSLSLSLKYALPLSLDVHFSQSQNKYGSLKVCVWVNKYENTEMRTTPIQNCRLTADITDIDMLRYVCFWLCKTKDKWITWIQANESIDRSMNAKKYYLNWIHFCCRCCWTGEC